MKQSFSHVWEDIHKECEWGKYPSESVVRFIARNYYSQERQKIKILDFGCGGGAHTWFLAREGFDVYAFDGSESAVRKTGNYLKNEGGLACHLAVMDGIDLKYDGDFFDCVIDNATVYSNLYENICKMYEEIFRVLKKGGRLYTSCFGTETQGYGTGDRIEDGTYENIEAGVLSGRGMAHFFSKQQLEDTLARTGYKGILIDTMVYTDLGTKVEMLLAQSEK